MRFAVRLAAPLIVAIVASACSNSEPTSPAVALDIRSARGKWQQSGFRSYFFTSSIACFCDPAYSAPMRVTVQNGVVTSVTDLATGADRPVSFREPFDSIFVALEQAAAADPSLLTLEFDPTYGYPTRAQVGSLAADAGYVITISGFRPQL